jgi:hypothetical protein
MHTATLSLVACVLAAPYEVEVAAQGLHLSRVWVGRVTLEPVPQADARLSFARHLHEATASAVYPPPPGFHNTTRTDVNAAIL